MLMCVYVCVYIKLYNPQVKLTRVAHYIIIQTRF